MGQHQKLRQSLFSYIPLALGGVLILIPLYLVIITGFKTNQEVMENFFALPEVFRWDNFIEILSRQDFFIYVRNSLFITVASLAVGVVILPLAAYPLARRMNESKGYKFLYFFLIMGIFIPFQVRMLPLIKWLSTLGIKNTAGLICCYAAGSVCEGVFLYAGYIVSMPKELEEAAYIDGASPLRTYLTVVFPLLKPMTATIIIKNGLWFWNDFTLPLLVLNGQPRSWTLVLFQYNFRSAHAIDYSMVFASLLLSAIPICVMYLFLQKNIIGGLTSGAVKE